jgi:hypothetical protein
MKALIQLKDIQIEQIQKELPIANQHKMGVDEFVK